MTPLLESDFAQAAKTLDCSVAALKAVTLVEAPHGGFNPNDTPVTLFEGHHFHRFTDGMYDLTHPDLSYPKWTRQFYGKTWEAEQDRLNRAIFLDREAALKSASWGRFQLMGFNHKMCGFDHVEDFVDAMKTGELDQLLAFVAFVEHAGLGKFLRRQDWEGFALGYNGPREKENDYDARLAAAYVSIDGPTAHVGG